MSLLSPQFQVLSDLHLETPLSRPQYTTYTLEDQGGNILLLGDIGLVKDSDLFVFLRRSLEQNRGLRIFYVLGNHEPYQTTLEHAVQKLRDFEQEAQSEYGGRFKFLFRDRYDIDQTVTILGCTLWTAVQPHQSIDVYARLTDFNEEKGIHGWSLDRCAEEHGRDLEWLNTQVHSIQTREPHRQIVIATHHCPTVDPRATDPAHRDSPVGSGFASDLSGETCWVSPVVKMWAFGHTHCSCCFRHEKTGNLVVSNQKGYVGMGRVKRNTKIPVARLVEAREDGWQVHDVVHPSKHQKETAEISKPESEERNQRDQQPNMSILQRTNKRIQALLRLAPRPTE